LESVDAVPGNERGNELEESPEQEVGFGEVAGEVGVDEVERYIKLEQASFCCCYCGSRLIERCVLAPSHPRSGLTISGFYYISLNREAGLIEGLYYDPGSSPYQYLTLNPEERMRTFPAYEFR
jgi:hypothetical protein